MAAIDQLEILLNKLIGMCKIPNIEDKGDAQGDWSTHILQLSSIKYLKRNTCFTTYINSNL